MNLLSINNRFIVEPYLSDRAIKVSQNGSGFAMIQQKVTLKGLKLLVDTMFDGLGEWKMGEVQHGQEVSPKLIKAGSIIYIREEYLHTQPWAKQMLECDAIEGKFMIVDKQFVEFIHYA